MKTPLPPSKTFRFALLLVVILLLISELYVSAQHAFMQRVPTEKTGITFSNVITESDSFNILLDFSAYNGGGVGVGDLDNDGKLDLIFTGTQVGIKVYRNMGDWKFADVTEEVGFRVENDAINTGVLVADVTGDGWLDIYIARRYKQNLFFVNNGDGTFTEKGLETGLALQNSSSTIAAAVDYNRDGHVDLFIVNNGEPRSHGFMNPGQNDKLFRNNGDGSWTDVTEAAGIEDNGYGLSASIGDVNDDGWPDIFVANDFEERDKLWLNNGNGTFTDVASEYFQNMSWASMGSDIADVNDDGLLDILTVDMFPENYYRRMTQVGGMSIYGPFFDSLQRIHNTVQINRGYQYFTNMGYLTNMAATDWSWAVLVADYNNDGKSDVFITNGVKRDIGDQDYIYNIVKEQSKSPSSTYTMMPTSRLPNYMYLGRGDLKYHNVAESCGMPDSLITNGAAYADLDGDGDLDLILNNTDTVAFIYQNLTVENKTPNSNFLRIQLRGSVERPSTLSTRIIVHSGNASWVREQQAGRGFHSTVDPMIHVGLGGATVVDSVVVRWPDGSMQRASATINSTVVVERNTKPVTNLTPASSAFDVPLKAPLMTLKPGAFPWAVRENFVDDFKRERLLPYRFSDWGPGLAWRKTVDIKEPLPQIVIAAPKYTYTMIHSADEAAASGEVKWGVGVEIGAEETGADNLPFLDETEDVAAVFFDANGDGVDDLYVVTGGNEFDRNDAELKDKLYLCDKSNPNKFVLQPNALPDLRYSGSCVAVADFDKDSDLDLFVGSRVVPGRFPEIPRSVLLRNTKGQFVDVTDEIAPGLAYAGMVTSAAWLDYDGDGDLDLLVVGEWMTPRLWSNTKGRFTEVTSTVGLGDNEGWWLTAHIADVNNDGRPDILLGNIGKNCRYVPQPGKPLEIYSDDYDDNGSIDPIVTFYDGDVQRATRAKSVLVQHVPVWNRKFPLHSQFAVSTIDSLISPEQKVASQRLVARTFESGVFLNTPSGFKFAAFPAYAQVAPVHAIVTHDVNHDGKLDVILAGNNHSADGDAVGLDAGIGVVLAGNGAGGFTVIPTRESGFAVPHDARRMAILPYTNQFDLLFVVCNGAAPMVYEIPKE